MQSIYLDTRLPRVLATRALGRIWPDFALSPLSASKFAVADDPPLPGAHWIRVRNIQCGICATDLSLLRVDVDPRIAPAALPGLDRVYLGHEVVGRVVETGPAVTRVVAGDRVIMDTRFQGATCLSQEIESPCRHCRQGNHALCENAAVGSGQSGAGGGWGDSYTAHETEVYGVPDHLSDDQALMIEPLSVGLRAALRRPLENHVHGLVVGCGMVGLNTLQCVRAVSPDARITVLARHPHQAQMAHALGADEVVQGEDPFRATARITGGHLCEGWLGNRTVLGGFDVVYDCVGSRASIEQSLRLARAGGAVVLVGLTLSPLRLDLSPVWHQEVELVGVCGHGAESWCGDTRHGYDHVVSMISAGKLAIEGMITHRFALRQWREAVRKATDRRAGTIRVVLDCAHGDRQE